ncbi:HalOD1 output domain-containing protein [Halosolutus halophilus]|uniref:HalOD1 output domain-containing protein n=1 Tax=Halosolutus halophilus TaxID=1552990 RepID=UPI003CE4671D
MDSIDTTSRSVQTQYDWGTAKPSIAIIDAIATLENVEPIELSTVLDTTLFDHVDPESLDTLLTADGNISISFTIGEYTVQIDGNTLVVHYS